MGLVIEGGLALEGDEDIVGFEHGVGEAVGVEGVGEARRVVRGVVVLALEDRDDVTERRQHAPPSDPGLPLERR